MSTDAHSAEDFAARYRRSVGDAQLAGNLLAFQQGWQEGRTSAFEHAPHDFEELRRELVAAKDRVIADPAPFLDQFTAAARANGIEVHRAAGPDDVAAIVAGICRRLGTRTVIKTKSMATEEVHLNAHLAEQGIDALETDVGEWIVQARGETPSHMVMPAIHLNRQQVAATLHDHIHVDVDPQDVGAQVRAVRDELRPQFLDTAVGVTGANALIAQTGSVLVVTNEGNESLLTAAVRAQVVIAGEDKLLPTMADAVAQLRLLARSATGQQITTYTSFVHGPAGDGQELHVVLLDNGRSAMRADPLFAPALRCIRCAACASVCPPYQAVGGHVFGHVYSGAIGLVTTPFHHGLEHIAGAQSLCVSCNACQDVCPVDIPLPRQILEVRRRVAEHDGIPRSRRLAFAVWQRPRLFHALAAAGAVMTRPLRDRRTATLRLPLPRRHSWRRLPAPQMRPARARLTATIPPAADGPLAHSAARGLRVALFVQCLADRFLPQTATSAARLLSACGATVLVPPAQHCCGLPMLDSGDTRSARRLAEQTIATLEATRADWVVSPAASCVVAMVHEYPDLFAGDPPWQERARRLAERTVDVVTFLDRVAKVQRDVSAAAHTHRGTAPRTVYHPFCQTRTLLHADGATRRILTEVCGVELVALPEADVCCGFGGATSIGAPEVGRTVATRKLRNVDSTGAAVLLTDNPGCLMHLAGASAASGRRLQVGHVVDVIAEQLCDTISKQPRSVKV